MWLGEFAMTIGGQAVTGASQLDVVNPATEQVIARIPDCSRSQLDAAVAAARAAFPAWRATAPADRRAMLVKIGGVMKANAEELARLFTLEQGRPLDKARQEVLGAAYWCGAVARQELPVTVHEDGPARRVETRHVPLGVVGAIVPWNFPVMLAIWKLAPALLAGNCVVLKPSPFTPLTMLRLGELLRADMPPGVFNVVCGGDDLGPWMTGHEGIDKISFTGSTATGKRVMAGAAANLKRVTLELGGNDAAIVMPDVDVEKVAAPLFWSAFSNSGQLCIATKRLFIHDAIYDRLSAALADFARTLKVGDGMQPGTELGPLQNRRQFDRVRSMIDEARATGLRFLTGGEVPKGTGYFIPVTLVDNPPDDSAVVAEEAFGPLLPLLRFHDVDEVVTRANASIYGLAGSVWTGDLAMGAAIAARLETGTVWVNEAHYLSPLVPFGGHKQSGIGIENGVDGLLEFTNAQTISIRKGVA